VTLAGAAAIALVALLAAGAAWALRELRRARRHAAALESERARLLGTVAEKERGERALQRAVVALEGAREAAVRASEAKSHFLARASHELRTPLASLVGYAELLLEDASAVTRADLERDAGRIVKAGRQLARLVDDLLDLSRIDTTRLPVELGDVGLAAALGDAADVVRPLAAGNGNRLAIRIDEGAGTVRTDPRRLQQILVNLLGNAAKFTRDGEIRVGAREERRGASRWTVLEVSDTGIGMTRNEAARAFDEFWQARPGPGTGAGLGLPIARRLTELLGGTIEVASTPGAGTTVTVALPEDGPGATPS
jgi:adenylate cyclase